ncbi:MAG TPA: hypothetical protein VHM48_07625 [Candidatus Limnocylindrales bacterium]|nr:hypothetical protein [Candidatus Limnocylindrales bacterium]
MDGLAMSADGTRLAVVRRGETSTTIDIHVRRDDAWASVRTVILPGVDSASVAWLD